MDLATIFKAYDIRGRVPRDLGVETARRIGFGFARFAEAPAVAVGRDCRLSSPALAAAFAGGMSAAGAAAVDLGQTTTDMVYFAAGRYDMPGAMVTASHNPPEWNGIKLCLAGARPVGEDSGLGEVRRIAEAPVPDGSGEGFREVWDISADYVDHLFGVVSAGRMGSLRIVVDGGNGMAGCVLPAVMARTPVAMKGLYLEPDGTFPNHPADPLRPENLVDLIREMESSKPDLGIAFDGDADRAFFVDDRMQPLPGSTVTAIIAAWFLQREPGAAIVHNLICSRAVPEAVRRGGGTPIRTRVGHSFIKQVMAESGAVFGGEHSGHYYFRDNYRADSGILASLVVLQVVSEAGVPLSELRMAYEPYYQSGEINLVVDDPVGVMESVADAFTDANIDRLDGLTVTYEDRWFNLRPSNTEPLLRLNIEADEAAAVDDLSMAVRTIAQGG